MLDEALRSHIVIQDDADIFRFAHGLIRETLVAEISLPERVGLHAKIAEMLESCYKSDLENYSARILYHYYQSKPLLGNEKIMHYALMAGGRALQALAVLTERSSAYGYALVMYGCYIERYNSHDSEIQKEINQALEIARKRGDLDLEQYILIYLIYSEYREGNSERAGQNQYARKRIPELLSICTRAGESGRGKNVHAIQGFLYVKEGNWEAAQRICNELKELPPRTDVGIPQLSTEAAVALFTGDVDKAKQTSRDAARRLDGPYIGSFLKILREHLIGTADRTHLDALQAAALKLLEASENNRRDRAIAHEALGVVAMVEGDHDTLSELYQALEPELCENGWMSKGLFARKLGLIDDAVEHLERSVE